MEDFKILSEIHCFFVLLPDGSLAVYDIDAGKLSSGFLIRCGVDGGVIECDCHVTQ